MAASDMGHLAYRMMHRHSWPDVQRLMLSFNFMINCAQNASETRAALAQYLTATTPASRDKIASDAL